MSWVLLEAHEAVPRGLSLGSSESVGRNACNWELSGIMPALPHLRDRWGIFGVVGEFRWMAQSTQTPAQAHACA
jgi:hypothetical protein